MDNEQLLKAYLKKKGKATSSTESYLYCWHKFMAWAASRHMETEYMTYSELLDYIAHLRKRNLSQRSIQSYMIAITHYYEALVEEKQITHNPGRYLDIKTKPNRKLYPILSRQQLENLYTAFDVKGLRKTKSTSTASAIRNKIATGLMVFQGLDTTALQRLTTKDIDVLGGAVRISGGRSYKGRTLALQAVQIIELDRYINQTRKELQHYHQKETSDQLLITGYASYRDAHRQRVMRRLKRAEPQLQSARQIRASVITHWLKQYNLREVQYMAGHKRIQSTEAYQRNDTEGLQIDIDRFHPMNGIEE